METGTRRWVMPEVIPYLWDPFYSLPGRCLIFLDTFEMDGVTGAWRSRHCHNPNRKRLNFPSSEELLEYVVDIPYTSAGANY